MTELHAHTNRSDGRLSPEALVALAADSGVVELAITDHDTVAAYTPDCRAAAAERGLRLVGGIEASARAGREDVHLLGLGIQTGHEGIAHLCRQMADRRLERAQEMVGRLDELGAPVQWEVVSEQAAAVVTRPHLAAALEAAGHVSGPREAFDRFLARGAAAWVPLEAPAAADWIEAIHLAGGIAVLAHPGDWTAHRTVLGLVDQGLDGLEVCHPSHDANLQVYYQDLADRLGLVSSGGSDFHGRYPEEADRLGRFSPPAGRLARVLERLTT